MSALDTNRQLGVEIKTWLVRRGLRQADLATALGISQPSVSQRLLGKISFHASTFKEESHD